MHKLRLLFIFTLFAGMLSYNQATAQANQKITVSGTVFDEAGQALVGVNIIEKGTTNGVSTLVGGKYTISVARNAVLQISYMGYQESEISVDARTTINIVMVEDATQIEEVVAIGYGVQKKSTLTGAVASVKTEDLVATKSQNMQNSLTGKMAGLRVIQKTAEPGNFNNELRIRGSERAPLIIIDGVERDNMARLENEDIESVSILKDAAAAIYGVRAADGVVLITTKKGSAGTLELNYSGNFGWQMPSGLPELTNVYNFMDMTNEKTMRVLNVAGQSRLYPQQAYDDFRSGARTETDWWNAVMNSVAPQMSNSVSATGGNDKGTYFLSLSQQSQDGFLKSGAQSYDRIGIRSNVTANITKRLKVNMNISATREEQDKAADNFDWILRALWRQRPNETIFIDEATYGKQYPRSGGPENTNSYAMSHTEYGGYRIYRNNWLQTNLGLTYDIPWIEGLQAKGTYSYDYYFSNNKMYLTKWNNYTDDLQTKATGPDGVTPNNRREMFTRNNTLMNLSLNYAHTFGKHDVSGMVLYEETSNSNDNFYAMRYMALPVDQIFTGQTTGQEGSSNSGSLLEAATRSWVGRFNYGYASKYLAEFTFRIDESSWFAPSQAGTFFPGISLGWRASEEGFWKNSFLSFINNFKLRASYGEMGSDAGIRDFAFLTGYEYPGSGGLDRGQLPRSYTFGNTMVNTISSMGAPNPNITFFRYKNYNAGFDLDAWNGLLGVSFDVFQKDGEGLLATRVLSLPGLVGTSLPQENLNSLRISGVDLEVSHRNKIGQVRYSLKGTFGFARQMNKYRERAKATNSYNNWRNNNNDRWSNTYWGYIGSNRMDSWEDIYNSQHYVGQGTILGDYEYVDWNGDGRFNDQDRHPIGYGGQPMYTFGLTVGANWKGFDLNMLFQGAASNKWAYEEQLLSRYWSNGGFLEMFTDRWRPVDPTADPYRTDIEWIKGKWSYADSAPDRYSTFNIQNGAYLRLKSLEIGYTLPGRITDYVGLKNVRVYANGYNLFTITELKYLDPEHPEDSWGRTYPLNKTFSVGVNVKF